VQCRGRGRARLADATIAFGGADAALHKATGKRM